MDGHHAAHSTTTIVSGPLCADAADCRLLASALFGEMLREGDASGLRIGVIRDVPSEDVDPEVRVACEEAIEMLRAETGGSIEEVRLPDLDLATIAAVMIANSDGLAEVTPAQLNRLDPEISLINRAVLKYRMLIPSVAVAHAHAVRSLTRRRLAALFEDVDVIAWPTVPAPAPPLEAPIVELPSGTETADRANVRGGALANLTGTPALSVPVGLTSSGLPIGLQLGAAWGRDELLLDAAEALERANDRRWVDARPPLAETEPAAADGH
jgi:Asp-tRNA(Asn)/Glu-tRNA(Gln) amidotransferase A subunit family amidase